MREAAQQLRMSRTRPQSLPPASDSMERLEERLASLVDRHREALKLVDELRTELQDERAQIAVLVSRLEARDELREQARLRVAGLLERIMRVQAVLTERAEADADAEG